MDFSAFFWIIVIALLITFAGAVVLLQRRKRKYPVVARHVYSFKQPYKLEHVTFSVFLVGDMGALPKTKAPITVLLEAQMCQCEKNSAVVFLGDNTYPKGLPKENHESRPEAERRLKAQLDVVKKFKGQVYMISGNHDWNKGRKGGWAYAKRQERFVEEYLSRGNVYLPDNGCPGPVSISLAPDVQMTIINTQWWVQQGEKPQGKKDGCTVETEEEFFEALNATLDSHKYKKQLVIGHHPMYSNSAHGGKFTYKQHLFPLTSIHKKFYFPLPVVGSLYPLYRKVYGAKEDISYPSYRRMRKQLLRIFCHYPNLVYAAGHDHNLQYFKKRRQHYLVSGAGCKLTYVHRGGSARYAATKIGFMRLNYLNNGETWLEVWHPVEDGSKGYLAYTAQLD